jgi:molecular chaperone GrpE
MNLFNKLKNKLKMETNTDTENKADASNSNEMMNEIFENLTPNNSDENSELNSEVGNNDNVQSPEELLKQEIAIANDKYIRLYSEFDNYRRRTAKEKIDLMNNGASDFYKTLLPVIDDFDRALKSINEASDVEALKIGVDLIYNKFKTTLTSKGLKEMESVGQVFDAELHEAITQIPSPSADMKGKIVDELEKGYYLNEKVIRYAKVVVGN